MQSASTILLYCYKTSRDLIAVVEKLLRLVAKLGQQGAGIIGCRLVRIRMREGVGAKLLDCLVVYVHGMRGS